MITKEEILMGRVKEEDLSPELQENLNTLVEAVNKIRKTWGKPMIVTSGYRTPEINMKITGAAKKSAHMSCQAVDFKDTDNSLGGWCMRNMHKLTQWGLYLEHPRHTPGWCHLQIRRTRNNPFLP